MITIWRRYQVPTAITVQKFELTRLEASSTCSVYGFTSSVDIRSTGCKGGTGWHSFLELERKTKTGRRQGSECLRLSFFVPIGALILNFVSFRPWHKWRDCDKGGSKENTAGSCCDSLLESLQDAQLTCWRPGLAQSVPPYPQWKWHTGQGTCGADTHTQKSPLSSTMYWRPLTASKYVRKPPHCIAAKAALNGYSLCEVQMKFLCGVISEIPCITYGPASGDKSMNKSNKRRQVSAWGSGQIAVLFRNPILGVLLLRHAPL